MGRKIAATSIISDSAYIGSKMPWWVSLILGIAFFLIFYFVIPLWLTSILDEQNKNMFYPMLEAIFGRRIHWFQWLGTACGLVFFYFAIRNYLTTYYVCKDERSFVAIISKVISRYID